MPWTVEGMNVRPAFRHDRPCIALRRKQFFHKSTNSIGTPRNGTAYPTHRYRSGGATWVPGTRLPMIIASTPPTSTDPATDTGIAITLSQGMTKSGPDNGG